MPDPYSIKEVGENSFSFTTFQGLEYDCRFKNVLPFLDSPILGMYDIEVLDFEFYPYDPTPNDRKCKDERISETIKVLLSNFFNNPLRVLIYICDSTDNRDRQRSFLFTRWFGVNNESFTKILIIDRGGYGGVFFRNDFPFPEILQEHLIEKVMSIFCDKMDYQ